ncbi:MAG: hypothetical protein WAU36_09030 [Cyclobacteriaceae bacterium]
MDNLEDDSLREVFSQLRGYESKKSGITWASVSRHLGSGGFSKAVILSLAILIITAPSVFTFESAPEGEVIDEIHIPETNSNAKIYSSLNGKVKPSTAQITENEILSNDAQPAKRLLTINLEKNETAQPSEKKLVNDSNNVKPSTLMVDLNNEKAIVFEEPLDTIALPLPEEDAILAEEEILKTGRPISIAVSAFYAFGVVDPLPTDEVVLTDYQSRPGYGVNLNMMIPVFSNHDFTLDVGPTYQLMRKGFDFKASDFGSERISQSVLKNTLTSHFLGAGFQFGISKRQLLLGSTIMKSMKGSNSLNDYTGPVVLFLQAAKEINLKNENKYLQLGISSGIPLSGPYSTFKYFPIQLSVGIRNVFQRN